MTDKELLYIKTLFEEKSITKAAAKLYLAQPSLTQTLQKIEKQLGTPLFRRLSTGLRETEAGKDYYKMACEVLDAYNRFLGTLNHWADKEEELFFGTTKTMSTVIVQNIYPSFIEKYPNVRIHIYENNFSVISRMVSGGELDLVICPQDPDRLDSRLYYQELKSTPFLVIGRPGLFETAREEEGYPYPLVDPEELTRHKYVESTSSLTAEALNDSLRRNRLDLSSQVFYSTDQSLTAALVATKSDAFCFGLESYSHNSIPSDCLYCLPDGFFPRFNIYAVSTAPIQADSLEGKFVEETRKWLVTHP